ncbi:nucleotidyltransferase domain-containing protein [Dyadobacter subterraneus]|uniref:Nucleotidyltransferase domain-containing protein n=1 Tax=Dyadobacter subterraneus TaxID=2773304 RepID=A0ABR9WJW3_9BACT|nr:nucleotidyltransferase domain-containing protein [Dyadobacter subterraneus]MBE9465770.1 nucleotidyltransferase domain-containing protein [Dyadobacter subterraneus]
MKKFGLKQEHIDMINQCFAQYSSVLKVVVYGSRAKGNYKNGSDIDLTIIDQGLSFSELLQIENKLDDLLLPYKIDLSLKRQISNSDLIEHIERVGEVFYEK